jgi:hypothetical protein
LAGPTFRLPESFLELPDLAFKLGDSSLAGGVQISVSALHPVV